MQIYLIRNLTNNKIYIGKEVRIRSSYYGSGVKILKAIKKYGKQNFSKEILEVCTSIKQLCEREQFYIAKYNSRDPKIGYNLAAGGEGGDTGKSWTKNYTVKQLLIKKYGEEQGVKEYREVVAKMLKTRKEVEKVKEEHLRSTYYTAVIDLWNSGAKISEIHNKFRPTLSILYIRKFLKEYFLEQNTTGFKKSKNRGNNNGNSKLTEAQVLAIREEALPFLNNKKELTAWSKKIKAQYNISTSTFYDLIKNRSYKNISIKGNTTLKELESIDD